MWMQDYFQTELGIPVYFEPEAFLFNDKTFYICHGDGLGPGDACYKSLKKVFRNPMCQWLFGLVPPRLGIGIADYFSRPSRAATGTSEEQFLGEEKEWLLLYCRQILQTEKVDYFIFGHRHLPIDYRLSAKSRYINLGDWITFFTYAVFDGACVQLKTYGGSETKIVRNG
jgi:UDP-2,3-diacylglucosamine hydrolase